MAKIVSKIMEIIFHSGVLMFAFTIGYEAQRDVRFDVLLNKAGVTLPEILGALLGIYLSFVIFTSVIKMMLWFVGYLQDDKRVARDILDNWDKLTVSDKQRIVEILDEQERRYKEAR